MKRNFFTNRHRKVWVEKKDCERKRKKVIVEARASVKRKKNAPCSGRTRLKLAKAIMATPNLFILPKKGEKLQNAPSAKHSFCSGEF